MHRKPHGRAFYESLGSPKYVLAPMVDQSEFAWRLLTRSFLPPDLRNSLLAYTPMFHARMFTDTPKYRASHFEPLKPPMALPYPPDKEQQKAHGEEDLYLDGNHQFDRPLFVQFCANDPDELLEAAKTVQPYCDAVDLNLGCPQGIARRGHYGAFLQEDQDLIFRLINRLHKELDIPVTAKMRILETREKTLAYAKMILDAGASILTVHGRQRDQKGHNTGLADWKVLRYLRENLPKETVIFANGNILQHEDIQASLDATGADGVMSAEGNLYDPSIFGAPPAVGEESREYWRGKDGKGGYRMDAALRRYMDIIHTHVLGQDPPERKLLFMPGDLPQAPATLSDVASENGTKPDVDGPPPTKKRKREEAKQTKQRPEKCTNPNLVSMQAHLFHMLRPLVSKHHNVRDALARCKAGDVAAFENVLTLVEEAVKQGLEEYERDPSAFEPTPEEAKGADVEEPDPYKSSVRTVARCKRPYFICQPYVRPLPKEAIAKGSMQLSKKEKKRLEREAEEIKDVGLQPEGKIEVVREGDGEKLPAGEQRDNAVEIPREGVVCG